MRGHSFLTTCVVGCVFCVAGVGLFGQEKKGDDKPPPKATGDKPDKDGAAQQPASDPLEKMRNAYAEAAKVTRQHEFFKSLVGAWKAEVKEFDGVQTHVSSGTADKKLILGGRWLVQDFSGTLSGQAYDGREMLGYDSVKRKYVSTWYDTSTTGVVVCEGAVDAAGKVLTVSGSFDDPVRKVPRQVRLVRLVTTVDGPNKHTFEMFDRASGGIEAKVLEITYTKQ